MSNSVPLPWPPDTQRLRLGTVTVDLRYRRVEHAGGRTELPQRTFDLLLLFLAEPHVLHTRADLFRRIWSNVVVEDANLSQGVWVLRKALGEEGKRWIRTVAKQGYVFEPEAPIQAAAHELPSDGHDAALNDAVALPSEATALPSQRALPRPRRRRALLAACAALFALVSAGWWLRTESSARVPAQRVVLLDVEDSGAPPDMRWPLRLLHAWLEWKLSSLPDVVVLNAADVAAADDAAARKVWLLSAGPAPGDLARLQVQARLEGDTATAPLILTGAPEEAVALVDDLSRQVLAVAAPDSAAWPALRVDAAAARRYVEALPAREAHRWADFARQVQGVVDTAPDFALARLQLSQVLGLLGQKEPALEQLKRAQQQLQPLPSPAQDELAAQALALGSQHEHAAEAYAQLSARYPAQLRFRLEQARTLTRAGRVADALALLADPVWQRQTAALRVAALLARARAELLLGDSRAANVSIDAADRLAEQVAWEFERGSAGFLRAEGYAQEHPDVGEGELYETAARHFDAAGEAMFALQARLYRETGRAATPLTHLDALLAQARAAGYHQLEIDAVRRAAFQRYRAGDIVGYRARIAQTAAIAAEVGDRQAAFLADLDGFNLDLMDGDYASSTQRLTRLRAQSPQGLNALWTENVATILAMHQGQFAQALTRLDALDVSQDTSGSALWVALLACTRGDLLLTMGATTRARREYERCANGGQGIARHVAALALSDVALLSGDSAEARRQLRVAESLRGSFETAVDRWMSDLNFAYLTARSGDVARAETIYRDLQPAIDAGGLRQLQGELHLGLAECALARGDLATAQREMSAADSGLVANDWLGRRRLGLARVLLARGQGDLKTASAALGEIDRAAAANGDVVAELSAHSLLSLLPGAATCSAQRHDTLLARSGLRGASLAWMTHATEADVALQLAQQSRAH